MSISKELRYAMIRRAALKVQKNNKVLQSNMKLAMDVERIDRQDYKSKISYGDINHLTAQFTDTFEATTKEEWN
jgi:hypothetical protein